MRGNLQIRAAQRRARILLGFALPVSRRKMLRRAMFSFRKLNLPKRKFVSSRYISSRRLAGMRATRTDKALRRRAVPRRQRGQTAHKLALR
jgi:hypothetical protein